MPRDTYSKMYDLVKAEFILSQISQQRLLLAFVSKPLRFSLGYVFQLRKHMNILNTITRALVFILLTSNFALAQNINLLPKYGSSLKNEKQLAADAQFIKELDEGYQGNRSKAANDIAKKGWQLLRQGNSNDAMRRFNQAWLLDSTNGTALWGMAAIVGKNGKTDDSLKLFDEASVTMANDIDFAVDHAKTMGLAGAESGDKILLKSAFKKFEEIEKKAPQHVLNLQNWAICYFIIGQYAEAWKKITLAETAPRHAELDARFIADLQAKMPRPLP